MKREIRRVMTAFSEGQLPQQFSQYVHRLEDYIVEKTREKYEIFREWLNRVLSHVEKDKDIQMLKSFLVQCRDQVISLYFHENVSYLYRVNLFYKGFHLYVLITDNVKLIYKLF